MRSIPLRLTLVLPMLCAAAPVAAQFSAQPVILPLSAAAAPVAGSVNLRNDGKDELQFRIYAMDFDQDAAGEHSFHELGARPQSCASRMKVSPSTSVLRPGERQDVRVEMAPGASTCWSVVMLETLRPSESGSVVGQRIAVKVYGTPPDASLDAEISSVVAAAKADSVEVSIEMKNLGAAPIRPEGKVEVRTGAGAVVSTTSMAAVSILPGYARRLVINVPRPAAGTYLVVPILDFGGDFLAGGQTQLQIR